MGHLEAPFALILSHFSATSDLNEQKGHLRISIARSHQTAERFFKFSKERSISSGADVMFTRLLLRGIELTRMRDPTEAKIGHCFPNVVLRA